MATWGWQQKLVSLIYQLPPQSNLHKRFISVNAQTSWMVCMTQQAAKVGQTLELQFLSLASFSTSLLL